MRTSRMIAPTIFAAGAVVAALGMARFRETPVSTLRIIATDYGFEVEGAPTAGPVRVELVNRGKELHHSQILRLEEGRSLADLAAFPHDAAPPAWAVPVGGPGAVDPGLTSHSIQTLAAGTYAVICFIPSPDGVTHVAKGMAASFTVAPAGGRVAEGPRADLSVHLRDFAFQAPTTLARGSRVIRVINDGPQVHEMVVARLAPGKKADDLFAWFGAGMGGPPPASFIGGTVGIPPGGDNTVEMDFIPGEYLLLCFLPDTHGDGQPHVMRGMVLPVTVR